MRFESAGGLGRAEAYISASAPPAPADTSEPAAGSVGAVGGGPAWGTDSGVRRASGPVWCPDGSTPPSLSRDQQHHCLDNRNSQNNSLIQRIVLLQRYPLRHAEIQISCLLACHPIAWQYGRYRWGAIGEASPPNSSRLRFAGPAPLAPERCVARIAPATPGLGICLLVVP